MKLTNEMIDALNDQFNFEIHSAHLYASMAADQFHKGRPGFGMWLTKQYKEELAHAEKIHRYLDERNERVIYQALPAPQVEWDSPLKAMEDALAHEKKVSDRILNLVTLAKGQKDYATEYFLQWFVTEQVEEEGSVQGVIDKLNMVGSSDQGLYLLDKEMGQRQ